LLATLAPAQIRINEVLFGFLGASQFRQVLGVMDEIVSCCDRAVSLGRYLVSEPPAVGGMNRAGSTDRAPRAPRPVPARRRREKTPSQGHDENGGVPKEPFLVPTPAREIKR
jgi:hypothetical protein